MRKKRVRKAVSLWDAPAKATPIADIRALKLDLDQYTVPLDYGHDPVKFAVMRADTEDQPKGR